MNFNIQAIKDCYDASPFPFFVVKVIRDENNTPIDIILEYANKAYAELEGFELDDIIGTSLNNIFSNVTSEWLSFYSKIAFNGEYDTNSKYNAKMDKYLTVQTFKLFYGYCGCNVYAIAEEKKSEEALQIVKDRFNLVKDTSDIDFWTYNYTDKTITQPYTINGRLTTTVLIDNVPDSMLKNNYIRKDSQDEYIKMHQRLKDGSPTESGDFWIFNAKTKDYHCQRITYNNIFDKYNRPIRAYAICHDITKEVQQTIERKKLNVALANSNLYIWEYDIIGKRAIQQSRAMNDYEIDEVVENMPEYAISAGLIDKGSAEAYRKLHKAVENGAKSATEDICFITPDKKENWMRCTFTTVFLDNKPVSAIGCAVDISATKDLERRFKDEMNNIEQALDKNIVVKVRSNITQNMVESYIYKNQIGITSTGTPYTIGSEQLAQTGYTEQEKQMIRYYLNRERVLKAFDEGETYYSFDYKRKTNDGKVIWANTTVRTYQNPLTKDIMSFMYSTDINDEKIKESMINAFTKLEYDYMSYIDLKSNNFKIYWGKVKEYNRELLNKTDYTEILTSSIEKRNISDDLRKIYKDLMPEVMKENLSKKSTISNVYQVHDKTGATFEKRIQYSYLNEENQEIILTCTDVTDILAKEKLEKDALESALLAAKQASSAKSDFLSRMSHEIRTPMNAIIGMSTIAMQSIGNDSQVEDCISKIGISSRFLLSLINDILDMSRIESGKMLLKSEKISCEELFKEIDTICYTQAKAKEIDYESIVDSNLEDYYMGDFMKLQQVLINVLSNAIKFTPRKGRVSFRVRQLNKNDDRATVRFIVNDTGCGISEEFIPHLFEAFSQENSGTTTMYGGTGLGLAICKNLVDMMDGHIGVRSILGAGTEFTIDVKLGITNESKERHLHNQQYNFEQLSVLVVDDDITVCRQAVVTLKEIGVTSEWVDSGLKAIECVKQRLAQSTYYDIILLDWKMPEMNGIETAREIRKIVGPDVTIIIMTAYDFASIEYEAKMAGVNMMMSKPMFKSTLISAFEKTLNSKNDMSGIMPPDYCFNGKRLLLAEDHPLNIEVAKKLLQRKGFEIEVANNGLRALEMFTIAKDGYYDAILMDIRMPHMDGLQATKAIRHLTKKDAQTIPIIAMTANAFEEDIQKSKEAGMDSHLAKPIEPKILYQTLYDFLK